MTSQSLDIAWTLTDPPLKAASWGRFETLPKSQEGDKSLETRLGWPLGTLAALRLGFEKRLGRAMGWEDALPENSGQPSPIFAAAKYFKRGVASGRSGASPPNAPTSGSYQIHFHDGETVPVAGLEPAGLTIVDANVARLWPSLSQSNDALVVNLDEHTKTLESVAILLDAWRERGKPLLWTVIGGGLLSDVAGFAAALAGASAQLVPTTLLAMADASVGGKTGVNFPPFGKNQVGAFHQPKCVHIWTGWLKTLPPRELVAGGAECLKHAFLSGDMKLAKKFADLLRDSDIAGLGASVRDVVQFKAAVVREDPTEAGRRAILNFGHTMGHALEGYSQKHTKGEDTLLHGEAVALGMVFALVLSRRVAKLSSESFEQMTEVLRRAGGIPTQALLRVRLGGADLKAPAFEKELYAFIGNDKKNSGGMASSSAWVLLDGPGKIARDSVKDWTVSLFESEVQGAMGEYIKVLRPV